MAATAVGFALMAALHPDIQALLQRAAASGRPAIAASTPAQAREVLAASRAALGEGPEMREVRNVSIPTRAGDIQGRLFQPFGDVDALAIYVHGGGWVLGALEDYEMVARALAYRARCAVFMPDYRLAPEHPFPAGLEDVEDAINWCTNTPGLDLARGLPVLLVGDSAGGNLIAAAKAEGGIAADITGLLLIYPVTDCDFDSPTYLQMGEVNQPTRDDMKWFFGHYTTEDRFADHRIAVLRHDGLAAFPPTTVVTAQCDPLCHEGNAFAVRLVQEGVVASVRCEAGLPHGFIRLFNLVPVADEAMDRLAADLRALMRGAATASSETAQREG